VPEVLRALRAQATALAICTNGPKPYVDAVLDRHGLRPFFDAVRHLEKEDDTKPSMVRDLLDRPVDLEAAHANGLRAIGVTWGMCTPDELSAADALAHAPSELPALIAQFIGTSAGVTAEGEERP
jgi:phosphoglycolate phosphatase-like HAD superfamily hydrolase